MPELKKQDNLKVAVQIDDSSFISAEDGVLWEMTTDNEALLLIKDNNNEKEIKIKITK